MTLGLELVDHRLAEGRFVAGAEAGPRTPLMPWDGKMSIAMTETGLRVSGQVEIAGLEAAPDWRRAEILRDRLLAWLAARSALRHEFGTRILPNLAP